MSGSTGFKMPDWNWFVGKVEDVNDPKQAGRVKVRINGFHADEAKLPIDSLPWAMVAMPTTGASLDGVGNTPHALLKGSTVIGFFLDGQSAQQPCVWASMLGESQSNEVDVSKIARGNKDKIKNDIKQSKGFAEPNSPYKPVYPHNKVIETPSGHTIEIDDTQGAERLHVRHKSGSFTEFHTDGTVVHKAKKDKYTFVYANEFIHVDGNVNMVVNGNVSQIIGGNLKQQVDGNWQINVSGSWKCTVGGSANIQVGGSTKVQSGGQYTNKASRISLN